MKAKKIRWWMLWNPASGPVGGAIFGCVFSGYAIGGCWLIDRLL